jgi:hypothetical protein
MKHIFFNRFARHVFDDKSKQFNASLSVKGWTTLRVHLLQMLRVVFGTVSPFWVKTTFKTFGYEFYRIYKFQGLPGLVKYLKVYSVVIQQVIGGHREEDLTSLGPRISRTKGGLPRVLNSQWRKLIRNGDIKAIRWALTLGSFYRILVYTPRMVSLATITDPRSDNGKMEKSMYSHIRLFWRIFVKRRNLPTIEDLKPISPFPIAKSSPNSIGGCSTSPNSIINSRIAFANNPSVQYWFEQFASLQKRDPSFDEIWTLAGKPLQGYFTHLMSNFQPTLGAILGIGVEFLGKLGFKIEPAGKVRVFAMVDAFTQWAMKPLHVFLFKILRRNNDVDGTFDQTGPLKRIPWHKSPACYSFDLSSATDRLPVSLQERILASIFGSLFAHSWRQTLVAREYQVPLRWPKININFSKESSMGVTVKTVNSPSDLRSVKYSTGQPMGALSSWAMLAITHHFIVQFSAWTLNNPSYRNKLFRSYAVLGDDIVIWDSLVAERYLIVLAGLGVKVGLAKSVISLNGISLEFAKKTFYKGMDVSPIPFSEYAAATQRGSSFIEFCKKYQLSDLTIRRLLGMGYRSNTNLRYKMYTLLTTLPLPERVTSWVPFSLLFSDKKIVAILEIYFDMATKLYKRVEKSQSRIVNDTPGFNPWKFLYKDGLSDINRLYEQISALTDADGFRKDIQRCEILMAELPVLIRDIVKVVSNYENNKISPMSPDLEVDLESNDSKLHYNRILNNLDDAKAKLYFDPIYVSLIQDLNKHLKVSFNKGNPDRIKGPVWQIAARLEALMSLYDGISVNSHYLFKKPSKSEFDSKRKEQRFLEQQWERWFRILFKHKSPKPEFLRQASFIPFGDYLIKIIMKFLSRIIFSANNSQRMITSNLNVMRMLSLPIKRASLLSWRGIFLFWVLEYIYSIGIFSALIILVSIISLLLTKWDGNLYSIIPLIITSYNLPSIDLYTFIQGLISPTSSNTSWLSHLYNLFFTLFVMNIDYYWLEISKVLVINDYPTWTDKAVLLGTPLGIA